jgi:hypothetical protein
MRHMWLFWMLLACSLVVGLVVRRWWVAAKRQARADRLPGDGDEQHMGDT